jgi:hypothetical protein
MSINARAKGKRSELELTHILREHGWPHAARTSDGRAQVARGDVAFGPQGFHVESKAGNLKLTAALDQIARDAHHLDTPLLAYRPDRHPWLGVMYLEDLLPILKLREQG